MQKLRAYLASAEPSHVLAVCKVLFFSGLGTMILCLMLMQGIARAGYIWMGISVVGIIACFGGIIYAAVRLRCPDCGKSLMPGGRMPMSLPSFCPHCGKQLREVPEE